MNIEERGFRSLLRQRGRDLKLMSGPAAGRTLRGTLNRIGAYELGAELGNDPRGRRVMETPALGCPAIGSQNEIMDVTTGERFRVVDIGLDGPSYTKKFALQQLTENDT